MTHARFTILKHVFLENEARLVLLNLALNFFFPKNRPLKVYGILNEKDAVITLELRPQYISISIFCPNNRRFKISANLAG